MAASVGSLMIRSTLRPEMVPAPFVAWRLELLLDAGLVVLAVGEGLALDHLTEVPHPSPLSLSLSIQCVACSGLHLKGATLAQLETGKEKQALLTLQGCKS